MLLSAPLRSVSRLPVLAALTGPAPSLAPQLPPLGLPSAPPAVPRSLAHGSLGDRRQVAQRLLAFGSW